MARKLSKAKQAEKKLRESVTSFLKSSARSTLPTINPHLDRRCRAGWTRTIGGSPLRVWATGRGEDDYGLKTPPTRTRPFTQKDNVEFIVISSGWPLETVQTFVAKWNASKKKGKFFFLSPGQLSDAPLPSSLS